MYLPIFIPDGQDDGCSIHWTKIIDGKFRLRYRSWYAIKGFQEIWLDQASTRRKKCACPDGIEYEDAYIDNMPGFVDELSRCLNQSLNKRQAKMVFREVLAKFQASPEESARRTLESRKS